MRFKKSLKFYFFIVTIFLFVSTSYAEIVCVKKQVKANKKGVVNLTNSVRVESKTCPSGYKLLYNIPKGKKGDTGATGAIGPKGPKGDKGDIGATGPKGDKGDKGDNCTNGNCNTGYEDFCNSNVLESGTVITGTGNSSSQKSFCPRASQPIRQEDILINYKNQKHPECQGSYENPTAEPGKVCVYTKSNSIESGIDFSNRYAMRQRTIVSYSYSECLAKGLNWQEAGCFDYPGRVIYDNTNCSNYNNASSCLYHPSDTPSGSYKDKGYFDIRWYSDDFVCGLKFRPLVERNQRYWTGTKCMTNFDYELTGKREEVNFRFDNYYQACDYGDTECYCLSERDGYIEEAVWDGIRCVTSLTNRYLYSADADSEITESECVYTNLPELRPFVLTELSGEKCSDYNSCYWNGAGYCYINQNYLSFSSQLIPYDSSWAYTAP